MKILSKTLLFLGLASSFTTTVMAENTTPTTSNQSNYSVHCYFGGETVLVSEAKSATYYSKGTWVIRDIDGSVYETNAHCIVRTNN